MKTMLLTNKVRSFVRLSTALLTLGCLATGETRAADRVWSAGTSSTNFNSGTNYSPTGALGTTEYVIFDTATSTGLSLTASQALYGLELRSGAGHFNLNGAAYGLNLNNGGIVVRSGVSAVLQTGVSSHSTAEHMTFNVEQNASLTIAGLISPLTRSVYKKGAGTLVLESGAGTNSQNFLRTGSTLHFEEGTVILGDSARFEPGTSFAGSTMIVNLGTTSTSATLMGGGSLAAATGKTVSLVTYGSEHSLIAPTGDGTLEIQALNASAGSTFRFQLGQSLVFGSGTFTGGQDIVFEFLGGEAGELYTLFEYGALANIDEQDFSISTDGYVVDFWNIENGMIQVQFAAIPEPSSLILGGLSGVGVFFALRHKRRA